MIDHHTPYIRVGSNFYINYQLKSLHTPSDAKLLTYPAENFPILVYYFTQILWRKQFENCTKYRKEKLLGVTPFGWPFSFTNDYFNGLKSIYCTIASLYFSFSICFSLIRIDAAVYTDKTIWFTEVNCFLILNYVPSCRSLPFFISGHFILFACYLEM